MDAVRGPVLRISSAQLARNITAVQTRIAPSQLMLVMKDDAYGHGLEEMVDASMAAPAPVAMYGGYDVPTSLRIRARVGAGARVFAWASSDADAVSAALESDIDLGVGTAAYLRRVIEAASKTGIRARVHLKIDTGLHRNGFRAEEWADAVTEVTDAERAGLIELAGVWSHLAEASDAEDDEAARAFATAVDVVRKAGGDPSALHLTASAASWWRPELRGTISRIGAFCYGIRSADGPAIPGTLPIATLEAHVVDVRGDDVVIGAGWLHGIPSTLTGMPVGTQAGATEVLHIDATTMVVRSWAGASIGDPVRLFGAGEWGESDATALAERIDTVGEEILTRVSPLVPRRYS